MLPLAVVPSLRHLRFRICAYLKKELAFDHQHEQLLIFGILAVDRLSWTEIGGHMVSTVLSGPCCSPDPCPSGLRSDVLFLRT